MPTTGIQVSLRGVALVCLLLLQFPGPAPAADIPYEFPSAAAEARYRRLTEELRCLVCQNQNLADSHADLAQDLRREIYTRVLAGASDEDIIGFMVDRYGDFVLYRPQLKTTTMLLWFGPFLLLGLGLLLVYRIGRSRSGMAPTPLSAEEQQRVQTLLGRDRDHEP